MEEQNEATTTTTITWPVRIALKYPVKFGDETISSLEFRRGRMRDLKGVAPDGIPSFDQLLLIASRMSGQPAPVLDMLDVEDGAEVLKIAIGFFVKSLAGMPTP